MYSNRHRHRHLTEPETPQGPSIFDQSQQHHLNQPSDLPDVGDIKEQLGFDRDDPNVTVRLVPLGRPGTIADIEDILRHISGHGQVGGEGKIGGDQLVPADRLTDGGYAETQPDVTAPVTDPYAEIAKTIKHRQGLARLDDVRDAAMNVLIDVMKELMRATMKHGPQKSPHEGASVLREEYEELWDHVKADTGRSPEARAEAIQLAAMAVRYILDNIDKPVQ